MQTGELRVLKQQLEDMTVEVYASNPSPNPSTVGGHGGRGSGGASEESTRVSGMAGVSGTAGASGATGAGPRHRRGLRGQRCNHNPEPDPNLALTLA